MDVEEVNIVNRINTILFVDDQYVVIEPICMLLERFGYRVLIADSGAQAIAHLKKEGKKIDIVILDMLMPEMDGKETFAQLRGIRPDVPVLIASGHAYSDQIDHVMKNGCNGYIQKPYRASELHKEIQKILTETE